VSVHHFNAWGDRGRKARRDCETIIDDRIQIGITIAAVRKYHFEANATLERRQQAS
jgi:hypothetical protein